jgi:hypothetical protein
VIGVKPIEEQAERLIGKLVSDDPNHPVRLMAPAASAAGQQSWKD